MTLWLHSAGCTAQTLQLFSSKFDFAAFKLVFFPRRQQQVIRMNQNDPSDQLVPHSVKTHVPESVSNYPKSHAKLTYQHENGQHT